MTSEAAAIQDAQPYATEHSPLLSRDSPPENDESNRSKQSLRHSPLYYYLVIALLIAIFFFSISIAEAPRSDIFENIICDDYYRDTLGKHHGPEQVGRDCNASPVQEELALVTQVLLALEIVPALLFAVPYGVLSDRIGRLPVLLLSFTGIILSSAFIKLVCWWPSILPIRLVWLSPLFRAIGGGHQVSLAIFLTIVADVFDEKTRSDVLFQLGGICMSAALASGPASAAMMAHSSWLPYLISDGLIVSVLIIAAILLPNIRPAQDLNTTTDQTVEDSHGQDAPLMTETSTLQHIKKLALRIKHDFGFLFASANVLIIFVSFVVADYDTQTAVFFLQYVRHRLSWTYGQAVLLRSVRIGIVLVTFVALVPLASRILLNKFHLSALQRDICMVRLFAVSASLGYLCLAIAGNLPILLISTVLHGLGAGMGLAMLNLVTYMVKPSHHGALYSCTTVMSSIGGLLLGPLLSLTFKAGLRLGGNWEGLPWIIVGLMTTIATIALWNVRLGHVSGLRQ